jgi:hypothetical protein
MMFYLHFPPSNWMNEETALTGIRQTSMRMKSPQIVEMLSHISQNILQVKIFSNFS